MDIYISPEFIAETGLKDKYDSTAARIADTDSKLIAAALQIQECRTLLEKAIEWYSAVDSCTIKDEAFKQAAINLTIDAAGKAKTLAEVVKGLESDIEKIVSDFQPLLDTIDDESDFYRGADSKTDK